MLIDELFDRGIMRMGPSRIDPDRQVGVFNPAVLSDLPALRAVEMEKFHWLAGSWNHENRVPASKSCPGYSDIGISQFSSCENGTWICLVTPEGRELPHITYDPLSKQWIYMLLRGSYGTLRSARGWVNGQIVFTGLMTMAGINCEWRMTWTRSGPDRFSFINEEQNADNTWAYIDEWHFERKT
jgi:hypothetical protein